jgi:hypothetical protein
MADGGRDAGLWILLVITLVTGVCAAYTLLTVTGVFDNATATGRELRETTAGSVVEGKQPETTQPDSAASAPDETNGEPEERTDIAASAALTSAIGDSAMLGAVDALEQEMSNLVLIDAEGSRQAPVAIDLLRQYRAAGHLGDVVVVHIGNNGPLTAEQFDEMMGVLEGVRKVLVVNLTVPPDVADPVAVPNDAVLAKGVRRYPNKAVLVDWYSASAGHPEYFWDGIHLTPQGARAYADLISSRIGKPEGPVTLPGPRERFSWGKGGSSGVCVGPSSWCLSVSRQ